MYQRHICPSMGALRRPLAIDLVSTSNRSTRSFFASCQKRATEGPNDGSPSPKTEVPRETRRARSAVGFQKVYGLQQKRNPSSGQTAQQRVPGADNTSNTTPRPLIRKEYTDAPSSPRQPRTAAPPGTMVRAPTNLRVALNSRKPGVRGPDLRGRGMKPGGKPAGGPRRRTKAASAGASQREEDVKIEDTLSDGMVQQLLRLQRKEWDRVPYEPKYGHGSKAALELIEAGKKLFEGEIPEVKVPSKLDKRLGIVGRHGI